MLDAFLGLSLLVVGTTVLAALSLSCALAIRVLWVALFGGDE